MRNGPMYVVILSSLLGGCFIVPDASRPRTGAVATGEPLAVVDDVKTWTTTSKEKVGESVVKDENGNTLGTVESYQDKTTVHSMKVWYPFQGNEQLSDEDFFRIAADQRAIDDTEKARQNAIKWNTRGKYTLGAGVVGFVGGLVLGYAAPSVGVVAPLVELGGGLAMSAGWTMAYYGARQMQPEVHAVDRSMAERDAMQYNQNLGGGRTVGMGVSHSF
jgi:hypothetical protein